MKVKLNQDLLKQGREEYLEKLRNGEVERSLQKIPREKLDLTQLTP